MSFFLLAYPLFLTLGPFLGGDTHPIEKNLLDFHMQNFILHLLRKKNIKKQSLFQKLARPWKLVVRFGPIWENLNTFGIQYRLKDSQIKKRIENSICFAFHLSNYYHKYPTYKMFKKAYLWSCWWCKIGVKIAHLPQPITGASWKFYIYHFCL